MYAQTISPTDYKHRFVAVGPAAALANATIGPADTEDVLEPDLHPTRQGGDNDSVVW